MTDRLKGVVVTFEDDIREDDAEQLITAIRMIRGVLSVTPSVADYTDHMNREKVKLAMIDDLRDLIATWLTSEKPKKAK